MEWRLWDVRKFLLISTYCSTYGAHSLYIYTASMLILAVRTSPMPSAAHIGNTGIILYNKYHR